MYSRPLRWALPTWDSRNSNGLCAGRQWGCARGAAALDWPNASTERQPAPKERGAVDSRPHHAKPVNPEGRNCWQTSTVPLIASFEMCLTLRAE